MATQSITLHLPDELYQRIKDSAQQTHRTVEEELLGVIAAAVPADTPLPNDLAAAIGDLAVLPDDALWRAARAKFSARDSSRLESLHLKRQRGELSEHETREAGTLVARYERLMLVRAQATALLQERGYDMSQLGSR